MSERQGVVLLKVRGPSQRLEAPWSNDVRRDFPIANRGTGTPNSSAHVRVPDLLARMVGATGIEPVTPTMSR
jgi:hypothetical protein